MLTEVLAAAYNSAPDSVQAAISETELYRRMLERRREQYYQDKFERIEITVDDRQFDMVVPGWQAPYWIEHDPYDPVICHEPPASRKFVGELGDGDVVWDFGSHYGYFAAVGAQVTGAPEDTHVIELGEEKCWLIRETNDRLFDGAMHVNNKRISHASAPDAVCGDDYADAHGPPDFVKIDIEGAEVAAIVGMTEVIEAHRPKLLIETHPNKLYRHFDTSDEYLLDRLTEWYSDIQVCEQFRSRWGDWNDDWADAVVGLHDAAARTGEPGADVDDAVGYIDPDSYQVFCK